MLGATRPSVRMARTTPAMIDRAISGGGAGPDVEADRRVHPVSFLFGQIHGIEHGLTASAAGDESDEADIGVQRGPDGLGLITPVAGDDHRHRPFRALPLQRAHGGEGEAERFGLSDHRIRYGSFADDVSNGGGNCGSKKTSNAPPERHGLTTTFAPGSSGKLSSPAGSTRKSRAWPVVEHVERGDTDRLLGALTADEALDGAVRKDDGVVTRPS